MKRLSLVAFGLVVLALAACAPPAIVSQNVVPTIISLQVVDGNDVVLQGRYFGGGGDDSHVLVGANADGEGGTAVSPASWSPTRIEFTAPQGTNASFVFVVVNGVRSNGMPANLR